VRPAVAAAALSRRIIAMPTSDAVLALEVMADAGNGDGDKRPRPIARATAGVNARGGGVEIPVILFFYISNLAHKLLRSFCRQASGPLFRSPASTKARTPHTFERMPAGTERRVRRKRWNPGNRASVTNIFGSC